MEQKQNNLYNICYYTRQIGINAHSIQQENIWVQQLFPCTYLRCWIKITLIL